VRRSRRAQNVGEVRPTFFVSLCGPRYYVNDNLETIVRSELTGLGLDLFELRQRGSSSRPILDVRIDRSDGGNVTVDDCAVASRALEARLDREATLGERYVLEVSSPGIERPLRNADDWRRFAGRKAVITADAVGGTAEVEIEGAEDAPAGAVGIVRTARGSEVRVPLNDIRHARLAFHWKR
jgi:ribosome maturation factor RimP